MPNFATAVIPTNPAPEISYSSTGIIIQNFGASNLTFTLPSFSNTTEITIAGNLDT
jgi:hypothetical protein